MTSTSIYTEGYDTTVPTSEYVVASEGGQQNVRPFPGFKDSYPDLRRGYLKDSDGGGFREQRLARGHDRARALCREGKRHPAVPTPQILVEHFGRLDANPKVRIPYILADLMHSKLAESDRSRSFPLFL